MLVPAFPNILPLHCLPPSAAAAALVESVCRADAEQARLEPEQHLRAGRHSEWMQDTLQVRLHAGGMF
jgi:hypothetical protein